MISSSFDPFELLAFLETSMRSFYLVQDKLQELIGVGIFCMRPEYGKESPEPSIVVKGLEIMPAKTFQY